MLELQELNLMEFVWFGMKCNVVSAIIVFVFSGWKIMKLSDDEYKKFENFTLSLRSYIYSKHSFSLIFLNKLLFFVPMYYCCISLIELYNIMKYPGTKGLVMGCILSDRYSLIPLIHHDDIEIT